MIFRWPKTWPVRLLVVVVMVVVTWLFATLVINLSGWSRHARFDPVRINGASGAELAPTLPPSR